MKKSGFILLCLYLFQYSVSFSQDKPPPVTYYYSTLQMLAETKHSPHKASVYSALLPGLGQIYNKKYWKAPIVWLGLGGLTYSIIYNNRSFNSYQNELIARAAGDSLSFNPSYNNYPIPYLTSFRNSHRSNRDLSIVGLAAFYALNIVDATVDAHLYKFDVDRSLSLKAETNPYIAYDGKLEANFRFKLSLRF
jgi:hypothetical protein